MPADLNSPVALPILGVWVYLGAAVVAHEAMVLSALPAGSSIVLDCRLDEACLNPIERTKMQFTAHMMAVDGAPWRLPSTPEQMTQLPASAGFEVEEDLGPADLNGRCFAKRRDGLQIAGRGFRRCDERRPIVHAPPRHIGPHEAAGWRHLEGRINLVKGWH